MNEFAMTLKSQQNFRQTFSDLLALAFGYQISILRF